MFCEIAGIRLGQYLENGIMFAVDRQDARAVFLHGFHEQAAGHHQCFFVGQINGFAVPCGGKGGGQACGTDNGTHHAGNFGRSGRVNQGLFAV